MYLQQLQMKFIPRWNRTEEKKKITLKNWIIKLHECGKFQLGFCRYHSLLSPIIEFNVDEVLLVFLWLLFTGIQSSLSVKSFCGFKRVAKKWFTVSLECHFVNWHDIIFVLVGISLDFVLDWNRPIRKKNLFSHIKHTIWN